jgi:hypothetical protein
MKGIEINGVFHELIESDDIESYEVDKAYIIEDEVFVYRGLYEKGDITPGLYVDETGEMFVIAYDEGDEKTIADVKEKAERAKRKLPAGLNDLLNDIKSTPKEERQRSKRSVEEDDDDDSSKVKHRSTGPLRYDVNPDDDDMVRLIKETINEKDMTMQEVYEKSASNNAGYNLIYGLRKRNTLTYDSFLKWAEILGMRAEIRLIEKGSSEDE